MATLTMPTSPAFTENTIFRSVPTTLTMRSPWSVAAQQTIEFLGHAWGLSAALPPLDDDTGEAAAWIRFLTKLHGQAGRFYAGDPARATPRGGATGTPLVKGASQTGLSLITDGWTIDTTGIMKEGDYFCYDTVAGRELYMLDADAASDGAGDATLTLTHSIRTSPADAAALTTQAPTCVMRLVDDNQAEWNEEFASFYGLNFQAVEVAL